MDKRQKNIKKLLIDIIKTISDTKFQERIWVRGEGPEVNSFDEEINNFFDTLEAIDFSKKEEYGLSEKQVNSICMLRDSLDSYCDTLPLIGDDRKILKDPKWREITSLARLVYERLKEAA